MLGYVVRVQGSAPWVKASVRSVHAFLWLFGASLKTQGKQTVACMPCAFPKQALQALVWTKGNGEQNNIPEHGEKVQHHWISPAASLRRQCALSGSPSNTPNQNLQDRRCGVTAGKAEGVAGKGSSWAPCWRQPVLSQPPGPQKSFAGS